MRPTDKKTVILIGSLLAIAFVVIFISQSIQSNTKKFGFTEATASSETTIVESSITEATEPSTVETTTELTTITTEVESSSQPYETTAEATTEATTETTTIANANVQTKLEVNIYQQYLISNSILSLNDNNTYNLKSVNSESFFSGSIKRIVPGESVLSDTNLSKRKLKKLGLNVKDINIANLYYIECAYSQQVFIKDEKKSTIFFVQDMSRSKRSSFEFLIYFKENEEIVIVDVNNEIADINFDASYF